MKKSKSIRLVLLGGAALALTSCDDTPAVDAKFFADVAECSAIHGEAPCQDAFDKSRGIYKAEAPRFAQKEQCEAEFGTGNCENSEQAALAPGANQPPTAGTGTGAASGSSAGSGMGGFFMPMMMGYMLGNAFSQPVYRGPNNSAMMNTGGKFYNVGGFDSAGRKASFRPSAVSEVQRGGFGSAAAAHRSSAGS